MNNSILEMFGTQLEVEIPILQFIINLLLAALLSYILSWVYVRYGNTLSNRKMFGRNFMLLAMTTMVVISIVKSSLALSLGLVGALSIVRFRSAIKEPEELSYVFLCIAIGLGMGANQTGITLIAFFIVVAIIVLVRKFSVEGKHGQNMFLSVQSNNPQSVRLDDIVNVIETNSIAAQLKRVDVNDQQIEASFLIDFDGFDNLNHAKEQLQALDGSLQISYLDNQGII